MLSLFSCQQEICKYCSDPIKLSTNEQFFPAEGGEFEVTTQGQFWGIEKTMFIDSKSYEIICDSLGNNCHWFYDDLEFLVRMSDEDSYCISEGNYCMCEDGYYIKKIEGPWFTIDRVTNQKMIFSVLPNYTGKYRTLKLELWTTLAHGIHFTLIQTSYFEK